MDNTPRPNPDELLSAIAPQEGQARAHLRIYFGYAAGVGKTYAMLKGAHEAKAQGIDIVVGYFEPHGRPETETLLQGLEIIPSRPPNGQTIAEMDIDAILARKPQLVMIDEMAHTNLPGSRHQKRWQDIEELLNAGIDVYTTLNVQHISSLSDLVAKATGVHTQETLPDAIFDRAQEVILVDLPPDELLKRIRLGKVYKGAQADRALSNYFKRSNLVALRELALRRTADRVHVDLRLARLSANLHAHAGTREQLACLLDSEPATAELLRATARMAGALQCSWRAVFVESPRQLARTETAEERYTQYYRLAQELGGTVVHLSGSIRISEFLRWCRREGVSKVVSLKPKGYNPERWIERIILAFASAAPDILWISTSTPQRTSSRHEPIDTEATSRPLDWRKYLATTGIVLLAFIVSAMLSLLKTPEANLAVVYLLAVIISAIIYGKGASVWAACLSASILSFGLSSFEWRWGWENSQYLINFGVSLAIGLLASQITSRLKDQTEIARHERAHAEALYEFSSLLAAANSSAQVIAEAQEWLGKQWRAPVAILIPHPEGIHCPTPTEEIKPDLAVAAWVASNQQSAGQGTTTLPQSRAHYLPLLSQEEMVGVLAIAATPTPAQAAAYLPFANALASRLESVQIAQRADQVYWQAERERLRSDLLGSISQGLRTPLEVIRACASANWQELSPIEQQEQLQTISAEAKRLEQLVQNMTHLTRYESGQLPLHTLRLGINEYLQGKLHEIRELTRDRKVSLSPSPSELYAQLDPLLFAQVIFNLIENIVEHTPTGTAIRVYTQHQENSILMRIEDEGPGIPQEALEKIFEKYYRLSQGGRGPGLGLTVCRAIVEAHKGKLWAQNIPEGGLRINIRLPCA
jgi:two-component system, OmpR family, sensor histidine kinase KdpD